MPDQPAPGQPWPGVNLTAIFHQAVVDQPHLLDDEPIEPDEPVQPCATNDVEEDQPAPTAAFDQGPDKPDRPVAIATRRRFRKSGRPPLPIGTHGNIRYYKTDGGWRAQTLYRDLDGRSRYVERHGKTKSRAKTALLDNLAKRRYTGPGDVEITADTQLVDLAEAWWKYFTKKDRAPYTLESYRRRVDNQIIPGIGAIRIREATTRILDRFVDTIESERGPSTAKVTRTVLSAMFALAVRRDAISVNPVREVATISVKHKPAKALTLQQARELRAKIHANPRAIRRDLPDLCDMMLATGMRMGEALAVTWDCLNLDTPGAETVEIRGTVIRLKGKGLIIKPAPKSEAGFRTLAIPTWYAHQLRARKPADAQPGDPVFCSVASGKLRDPSNTPDQLRDAFDDAGYPWVTSHVYRKTVATLMDQNGCTAREAADQLGHAKVSMTQNVYFGRNRVVTQGAAVMEQIVPSPDVVSGVHTDPA